MELVVLGEEARDWPWWSPPWWSPPPWWTEALGYLSERTGGINRRGQFRAKVEISSDKVLRHTQELFHPAGSGAKHVFRGEWTSARVFSGTLFPSFVDKVSGWGLDECTRVLFLYQLHFPPMLGRFISNYNSSRWILFPPRFCRSTRLEQFTLEQRNMQWELNLISADNNTAVEITGLSRGILVGNLGCIKWRDDWLMGLDTGPDAVPAFNQSANPPLRCKRRSSLSFARLQPPQLGQTSNFSNVSNPPAWANCRLLGPD